MEEKRRTEKPLAPPQPKAFRAVGFILLAFFVTSLVVGVGMMFWLLRMLRMSLTGSA